MASINDYLRKLGKKGGKARAERLSPEQRIESARKAAQARWKKNIDQINAATAGIERSLEKLKASERRQKSKKG